MKIKHKKTFFLVNSIVWATVIFLLCTLPSEDIPNIQIQIPYMDKLVHAAMFFILAVLLCAGIDMQTHKLSLKWIFLITMIVCLLYGGLIEILQGKYFKRSADAYDFLSDGIGAVMGCMCYPLVRKYILKQKAE